MPDYPFSATLKSFITLVFCALLASFHVAAQAPSGSAPAKTGAPADPAGQGGAAPIIVEVARVKASSLIDDVSAVGTVRSNETVVLRPEISGRIVAINFREGQAVRKGQTLISLDASILAAEIAQAKAELELSRANLQRNNELLAKNFVSQRARDEAASNLHVLEARIALSRARYDKSIIRAPFSGTVGLRQVAVGDYVKEGADMVTLEDSGTVKVDFRLPERLLAQVRSGQKLSVTVDSMPNKVFEATVDVVDPQVDSNGRSFLVRGRLANPQGHLRGGMFARVRLNMGERKDALMIPEEAVVSSTTPQGNASFVFRVADGKATRVPVQTGLRRAGSVEVRSGLAVDDVVVIAGQIKIRGNESPVRVLEEAAPVRGSPTGAQKAAS